MIKIFSYRKILITTLLLLFALIMYNYPHELKEHISKEDKQLRNIYLIDENDYIIMKKWDYNTIDDLLVILLDNNGGGIKLLDYYIDNNVIYVNLSSEFYDISEDKEELFIESLVYSLTSYDYINSVVLSIEGNHLEYLPNSKKKLNYYLDRSIGINKKYDINTINDISSVTVYFNKNNYFIPITLVSNDASDKVSIIINHLTSNKLYNSNLTSHLSNNVNLINYDYGNDNDINLNFDNNLFNYVLDGSLKEEVKYAIYYSIYDSLGIENVNFLINDELVDHLGLAKSK